MCGIVAYLGNKPAVPLLLEGLKRLEYRGYDSAGIATLDDDGLHLCRAVGRVANVEARIDERGGLPGSCGLAHTRWATHGGVTEANAHPHQDPRNGICLVHNGIIENYATIRRFLEDRGHNFVSETDTEVLACLIGELHDPDNGMDLEKSVQAALREVTGAYAIAVVARAEPGVMVCARKGSPLLVGVGNGEYVVASDASAIISHTAQAITLDDYNVCRITRDGFRTTTIDNIELTPKVMQLEMDLEQIELGEFDHYMRKEIYEQPKALRTTMRGRLDEKEGRVVLGGLMALANQLVKSKRVILTAQGTALHAAMIG
ncbi:MAG: class II glutamine amidotransferase, partial [Planctomycetota bacterium]